MHPAMILHLQTYNKELNEALHLKTARCKSCYRGKVFECVGVQQRSLPKRRVTAVYLAKGASSSMDKLILKALIAAS